MKKVAYWDALPFNALREEGLRVASHWLMMLASICINYSSTFTDSTQEECWNMGMRSAYFNSADFHGRRERLIREAGSIHDGRREMRATKTLMFAP